MVLLNVTQPQHMHCDSQMMYLGVENISDCVNFLSVLVLPHKSFKI
jgi:hypothetical protein